MTKQEIAKRILIDEEALFERLVERAAKVFKLDKQGNIVWIVSKERLTDRERVAMVLLAEHLAKEVGISDSDSVENSEIAERLSIPTPSVSARLAELRELGVAHQEDKGVHRVIPHGIEEVLEDILAKFGEK